MPPYPKDARFYAPDMAARVYTVGHGRRALTELVDTLGAAGVRRLVDVRRLPYSRRNPQFNQPVVATAVDEAGIEYVHAEVLGGLRSGDAGEERFACLGQFASYVARMSTAAWQAALDDALAVSPAALMCAETGWQRCHRRWISELLVARDHEVVHLIRPGDSEPHRLHRETDLRRGRLYVCGELVA